MRKIRTIVRTAQKIVILIHGVAIYPVDSSIAGWIVIVRKCEKSLYKEYPRHIADKKSNCTGVSSVQFFYLTAIYLYGILYLGDNLRWQRISGFIKRVWEFILRIGLLGRPAAAETIIRLLPDVLVRRRILKILCIVFYITLLIMWYISYIPLHEIAHATVVMKYTDDVTVYFSNKVSFYVAKYVKALLQKKINLRFFYAKGNTGLTAANYKSLSDEQISKVACAGVKMNILCTTILLVIMMFFDLFIMKDVYFAIISFSISLYLYFISLYCWNKRYEEENPSDKALYKDPHKYRIYLS